MVQTSMLTMTERELRDAFASSVDLTLGVEEELMLVDGTTLELVPAGDRLLAALDDPTRFRPELPAASLEVITGICTDAREVLHQLADGRRRLLEVGRPEIVPLASGTHPTAGAVDPAPGDRYAALMREFGEVARHGARAFGLHVHVGVAGADRAVALADGLRSFMPLVAALAGNAPCLGGRATGLWSVRPKLAELFPRQGVPPLLGSVEAYADLLDWGRRSSAVLDGTHLWWEVRPHPGHGTVEVRVADQPTRVADAAAVAAVVHALAASLLQRLDADGFLPAHPTFRIEENRWRALRHGLAGSLLDLETGEASDTRSLVGALLDDLEGPARRLGGATGLLQAQALLERNGTERQLAVLAERGPSGLTSWLAEETRAGLDGP